MLITSLNIVNTRANFLRAGEMLEGIALDKYTFIRDAYLQRRRSLVFDGDVPAQPDAPSPIGTPASGAAPDPIYAPAPPATAGSAPKP